MALNSPGVEVKVINESFYVPAEPGTRPLIVVSTKQNKMNGSGTGIAVGTLKANAGKPYLLTSQRDLTEIFGTPLFYTDSSQNPIHGGELNEYGLQAAYSFLGVSNSAYVVRSDLDLGELLPLATAPSTTPEDGTYWFDVRNSHFGIFEWNSAAPTVNGGQKFSNKVPNTITDVTQINEETGAPLGSVGKIGEYAVVAVTTVNKIYYKNRDGDWVLVGSAEWFNSIATVQSGKTNPSFTSDNSIIINGHEVAVPASPNNTIAGLANAITTKTALQALGISAAVYNSRLEIYSDGTVDSITITKGTGDLISSTVTASLLGIAAGTYYAPKLSIQSHTNVPRYKISDDEPRPSGSIWIKTTNVNLGANWKVKMWNASTKDWETVDAPIYSNNATAIYGLDRSGGGKNIARGILYVQFNVDEYENPLATFTINRRQLPDPTTLTSTIIDDTTFVNGTTYEIDLAETIVGAASLGDNATVSFTASGAASDASDLAAAINSAMPIGTTHIVASVDSRNRLVIKHEKGGDFTLTGTILFTDLSGTAVNSAQSVSSVAAKVWNGSTYVVSSAKFDVNKTGTGTAYAGHTTISMDPAHPGIVGSRYKIAGDLLGGATPTNDLVFVVTNPLDLFGYTPYDLTTNSGTINLYTAPDGSDADYVVTNWKTLKYTASENVPNQIPEDGTLWYNQTLDNVDIMIHNGTTWVSYLDETSPYYDSDEDFQTDPNGPLVTATKPTAQSDGSTLRNGDIWIDSGDLENYPAMYKWDGYNLKWVSLDTTDQTTEDGVLFADARYNTNGINSDEPGDIVDLLVSNYLDPDSPDPDLYPRGMLLFNTRRSGNNVKRFVRDYIDNDSTNIRYGDESQEDYYPHRWVNESGNRSDGRGLFGRFAQRKVVVQHLKSLVDTNQLLRETEIRTFNLIACPGYTELIQNMVALNFDRKQTAFVIGDTPFRLPNDATSLNDWGSNARVVNDNGEEGLFSHDEYLGVYYPSGYTTDNNGNYIVVPASHMVLRSIALSDGVSFPWFAPAGTRRGQVTNALSVGYVDAATGEWQSVTLNEGQRDTLYSVAINPITFLSGAGIVIYGQKTRAADASALDRINVARLVVYLRGQLAKLAKPYIFEPNDKITRDELKSAAESIMLELVGQRGIYDYLVVCDESNNTPGRIDRNELYLDIAIEPVKAVEFIYIPLRLKNTGEIAGLGS